MKYIFKILILFVAITLFANSSYALNVNKLDKYITKSDINENSFITISIKNAKTGAEVYQLNKNKLEHPASTLKLFTTYSAVEELGYDYKFRTQFYRDKQNNLYIKLGADPLLTSVQLKYMFSKLKEKGYDKFNNFYFDDGILDKKEFSSGWMWDDDINPSTPKVSAYNLDGNLLNLNITKGENGTVSTSIKPKYNTAVKNSAEINDKYDFVNIERYNWINPEIIEIKGYIKSDKSFFVPISSMRRYFVFNIKNLLDENKINIIGSRFASRAVPVDAELIAEITHPIEKVLPEILQNSNNLMAETIFKLAGAKKYNATGSDELAIALFNEFYEKLGLKKEDYIIKDGCGVSRNNLFTADWVTSALVKLYADDNFEVFKENMAQPGDGTLSSRLFDLRGNAWLKTGSLSNTSTIAGYIHSLDGNTYSIAVFNQNFKKKQQDIKAFEDEIIKIIYNR